jgi:hypothetical protein
MTLNRALIAFVLTGLLSGAGMAAQAQTGITVRFGSPMAAVVASYTPRYQGAGSVWIAGYFDGARWIPGYWAQRVDSGYREQDHYSDRNMRIENYGQNYRDGNYGRNYGQNYRDGNYGRNYGQNYRDGNYGNRNDQRNRNDRNHYGGDRGNDPRDGHGGRH